MMRNKASGAIQSFIAIIILISLLLLCSYISHNYIKEATVVARENNEVIVIDKCGYEWSFFVDSTDTISKGDNIDLKMNDNNTTNNIFDDKIMGYKMR